MHIPLSIPSLPHIPASNFPPYLELELNTNISAVHPPLIPDRHHHPLGRPVEPGEESGVGVWARCTVGGVRLFYFIILLWYPCLGGMFLSRRPASPRQGTEYHR
jgi:hypothetical protein